MPITMLCAAQKNLLISLTQIQAFVRPQLDSRKQKNTYLLSIENTILTLPNGTGRSKILQMAENIKFFFSNVDCDISAYYLQNLPIQLIVRLDNNLPVNANKELVHSSSTKLKLKNNTNFIYAAFTFRYGGAEKSFFHYFICLF